MQIIIDDPRVSAATSAFMLLTTSSASLIQFLILGRLSWTGAAAWMVIGFVAAFLGTTAMSMLIEHFKKRSFVVFALTAYVAVGVALMGYVGIQSAIDNVSKHSPKSLFEFRSVCS